MADDVNLDLAQKYDTVAYAAQANAQSHPTHLATVATLLGLSPPPVATARVLEVGCSDGANLLPMAASLPDARFTGCDISGQAIAAAKRGATELGLGNAEFLQADLATLRDGEPFDYIVAHGVYSWIDATGRNDMRRFIDRHLAPGGLVYLSYNAMPGWSSDLPFQYLLREIAERLEGDSIAQFVEGMQVIDMLNTVGVRSLADSFMLSSALKQLREQLPNSYFSHEFLPKAWQPMYVTQVRADVAPIGLTPVGTAHIRDNFDSFVLSEGASNALAMIGDDDLRELARDYFLNQRFRRDVYGRGARRISEGERRRRLLETTFDLQRPAEAATYAMQTDAGRLVFDTEWSREIIAALGTGPKRIVDMTDDPERQSDLLGNALALSAANDILPVRDTLVDVQTLNEALAHLGGDETSPRFVALPSGTAVSAEPALVDGTGDGEPDTPARTRWLEFLGRYHSRAAE